MTQDLSPRLETQNFRLNTTVPRCQKADSHLKTSNATLKIDPRLRPQTEVHSDAA